MRSSASSSREAGVNTLARYLEVIVDPTFDDFYGDRGSVRLAYLACVAIFHAVDVRPTKEEPAARNSVRSGVTSLWNSNWWTLLLTILSMCRVPTKRSRQHALGYQSAVLSGSMKPAKAWT